METSFELGRVFGIRIGINWTWLLVLALVVWSLATAVFPDQNPGLSDAAYWTMASIAAVLFFVSVLLHELGHALQGRRDGVEIEGITLWLFGGVARLKGMYRTAGAEFRIAVAGPAVSFVIAAVLLVLAALVDLPTGVDGVIFWLGYINAFLLAFNLLPALPLDGGRVLHSALWRARGDLIWATRVGAAVGQGFGALMIGGGLILFFTDEHVSGIWLAFLGWFLIGAAQGESRAVIASARLGDLRVGDLMARDPVTVPPDMLLGDFMDDVVWRERHTTYPVVEDGRPTGIVPFRCLAQVPRREWDERRVRDCMLPADAVPTLSERERVADVLSTLAGSDVKRALVVDGGRLVGLLSITDVARALEAGAPGRGLRSAGR